MLGSITPLGERGRDSRWWLTAASYAISSALGGLLAGSAAGLIGATLGLVGLTLAAPVALLVIAAAALFGLVADAGLLGLRLPTLRRQVDERWIGRYRGWVVGAGFGFQLGLGVATIITASATWAALAAAVATQTVRGGAIVGLVFGGVRALPLLGVARTSTPDAVRRLHLRVFPTGEARPRTSNLNFVPGQSVANLVMARVGAEGQVSIHNEFGSTQVIVDVAGWYPSGSAYNAVPPVRLMDTRPGGSTTDGLFARAGAVGPGEIRALTVAGRGRVPATGAAAVVVNVTATVPTAAGYLTVFPSGANRPNASNLNFAPGRTVPNLVVAEIGSDGKVSIFNATGSTQVIADVFGWFPTGLRLPPAGTGTAGRHAHRCFDHRREFRRRRCRGSRRHQEPGGHRSRWRPRFRGRSRGAERDRHRPHHRRLPDRAPQW